MTEWTFAPGSSAAQERGCTCPRMDNNNGQGFKTHDGNRAFWVNEDCPLHGKDREVESETTD